MRTVLLFLIDRKLCHGRRRRERNAQGKNSDVWCSHADMWACEWEGSSIYIRDLVTSPFRSKTYGVQFEEGTTQKRKKQFNTLYCDWTRSLEVDRLESTDVVLVRHRVVACRNTRTSNPYCLEEPLALYVPLGPGSGMTILASLARLNNLSLCSLKGRFLKICVENHEMSLASVESSDKNAVRSVSCFFFRSKREYLYQQRQQSKLTQHMVQKKVLFYFHMLG